MMITVQKFMCARGLGHEGIYAHQDGQVLFALFDDSQAHEGLSTDNFVEFLERMCALMPSGELHVNNTIENINEQTLDMLIGKQIF